MYQKANDQSDESIDSQDENDEESKPVFDRSHLQDDTTMLKQRDEKIKEN